MYGNREEIRRIMIAVNVIVGIYERICKKMNISENALTLWYALDDGKPHSQKEICENWLIPRTTLNTIVKEYTKQGYIFLSKDNGKKEKEICLTEAGQFFAKKILEQVYEIEGLAMEQTLRQTSCEFVSELELFTAHLQQETRRFTNEPKRII